MGASIEMSKDEPPMVSILCITYNHERFLAQALESFLMQETTFPFEIVVGEDASIDGTRAVLNDYVERYPNRVKALSAVKNVGMIENMRRTQAACRGKYIALCEGDDYWTDPQKLQKQVTFLETNEEYVLSFHDAYSMEGSAIRAVPQLKGHLRKDASARDLLLARQISTLTVCYRNVLGGIPKEFDRVPALDMCLWSMLGEHGCGKFMKDISPAIYRIHEGGVLSMKSQDRKYRMTMTSLCMLSEYWDRRGCGELARSLTYKSLLNGAFQLTQSRKLKLVAWTIAALGIAPARYLKRALGL